MLDAVFADDGQPFEQLGFIGKTDEHLFHEAPVDFVNDLQMTRQKQSQQLHRPCLQRFGEYGVVGVGKRFLANGPGFLPAQLFLVHQKAHQFGDSDGGVGVVELNGHKIGKFRERTIQLFEAADNVVQGGGHEKVLLLESQLLARVGFVAGVEHFGNIFAQHLGLHRAHVVALIEGLQIEFAAGLGHPQAHVGDVIVAVAGNQDVTGHGHDHFAIDPAKSQLAARVPVAFDSPEKPDRQQIIAPQDFPRAAAPQPVVALLALVPVFDDLMEDAVVVAYPITVARQIAAGDRIHIAGGQAPQSAVA